MTLEAGGTFSQGGKVQGYGQGKWVTEDKERRALGEDMALGQEETEAGEDLGWVRGHTGRQGIC